LASRKTAPKPRQITPSEIIRDDLLLTSEIFNLEDELNYIRSQIKAVKGTGNYDDVVSDSLRELADRLRNSEGHVHTQDVASSIWTIVHSLNRYPNIIIFDESYNQIFAKVKMINVNTARVTFSEPVSGTAFLK
jgi:hypothetical protein